MRQKFKRIITLTCALALLLQGMVFSAFAAGYKDVKKNAWYAGAVEYVSDVGYMRGVSSSMFEPEERVDRAMLATVLYRISGAKHRPKAAPFRDVPLGQWYSVGISWCSKANVVTGYGGGKFGPFDPVTREDMVTMFYRFAVATDFVSRKPENLVVTYGDAKKVSSYAKTGMNWALDEGVIDGVSYTKLDPKSTATRAQLAKILMNFSERVLEQDLSGYRVTESNPEGFGIGNIRIYSDTLQFRLEGLVRRKEYRMQLRVLLDGKTCATETVDFFAGSGDYLYRKGMEQLAHSGQFTLGAYPRATLKIAVYREGKALYEGSVSLGKILQRNHQTTKLYFKGDKDLDSRILLYHEFTESEPAKSDYGVITTPARFEADILYMKERGYHFISLTDLLDFHNGKRALPDKTVIITFDDGYLSNYTLVYPILKQYRVPATIFVVMSFPDTKNHLTWEQMREMQQGGLVDIQSHSMFHEDHTTLNEKDLKSYIKTAYELLDKNLGKKKIRMLAYPYGRCNTAAQRIAGSYDTVVQCTTRWAALDTNRLDFTCLPRLTISHHTDIKMVLNTGK